MFTEASLVVDKSGNVLKWHLPAGRSAVHIPDSQELWDFIWEHRNEFGGTAHTHPGSGMPYPSHEDITTFSATELGLGKRFTWWIASSDHLAVVKWNGPGKYDYAVEDWNKLFIFEPNWLFTLRQKSKEVFK